MRAILSSPNHAVGLPGIKSKHFDNVHSTMVDTHRTTAVAQFRDSAKEAAMKFRSGKPIMAWRASLNTSAYWLGIGLLFFVGIGSYLNLAALTDTIAARAELRQSLNAVQENFSTILDAETGQRGYLLTENDSYLDPYRAATRAIDEKMERIESLSTIMPDQGPNIEALRDLMAIKLTDLSETVDLMKTQGSEAALKVVRTGHGRATMKTIRGLVAEIQESIDERLARNDRQMAVLSLRTTVWGILANVSAAVLFSLVFFVLRRELRRRKRPRGTAARPGSQRGSHAIAEPGAIGSGNRDPGTTSATWPTMWKGCERHRPLNRTRKSRWWRKRRGTWLDRWKYLAKWPSNIPTGRSKRS